MMGDPLRSSRVSSQKQNREGVVGAQSGQYRATVVMRARVVVDPGSGCDTLTVSYLVFKKFQCHTVSSNLLQCHTFRQLSVNSSVNACRKAFLTSRRTTCGI